METRKKSPKNLHIAERKKYIYNIVNLEFYILWKSSSKATKLKEYNTNKPALQK